MSTLDQHAREHSEDVPPSQPGQHELNSMLNAIAAQLLDADRRHTSSLNQIHERIAGMGREAEMMRHRVPEQFAPAFARIEAGVAELAQRLSQDGGKSEAAAIPSPVPSRRDFTTGEVSAADQPQSEPPMALRSANAGYGGVERRQSETIDRRTSAVDNFDIIESSLSDDDGDPWDRQSAEALAGVYETDAEVASRAPSRVVASAAPIGKPAISEEWLESRFAEIGNSIERSLATVRSDVAHDDLGQKLEKFEQHLSKMFEGVATQADIGAVRLIEAHVGEVVNHLVQTHDQLARLNVIEEQLGVISQSLVDVQNGAAAPANESASITHGPSIDVDAIARAAAEQTALRFVSNRESDRHAAADELRPLIERLMADSRHSEESTAVLLDTIQQAMIRILDRVESIEFQQAQRPVSSPPSGTPLARDFASSAPHEMRDPAPIEQSAATSLTDVIAAVAATNAPAPNHVAAPREPSDAQQPPVARRPDQQRNDFIADARRARNRLSMPDDTADVVIANAQAKGQAPALESTKEPQTGARPIRPVPQQQAPKSTSPSGPSPRLIVIALGLIVLLSGLWYTFGSGEAALPSLPTVLGSGTPPQSELSKAGPETSDKPAASETQSPADINGKRSEADPAPSAMTRTAATEEKRTPRTTLPLIGVAVDVDNPITASDMQQTMRHQSMAAMSGELGAAAAQSSAATAIPAAIVPSERETEVTSIAPSAPTTAPGLTPARRMTQSDMPPATLGPLSLRLAAANGDPSAQFEIGARFADGKDKAADFKEAAKWYQKSADTGFAQAEYRLGTLYERGLGLKADRALAIKWYQLAAGQGNIKAMHNLAVLSANQNDQSPDYPAAAHWFEEAAKRDLSDSQFNLAILYENGLGVPKNLKTAFVWISLAAREGDAEAVRRRDILRGKLTAEETSAADDLIASWKPVPYDRAVNDARAAGEAWKKNPNNGVSG